jgi:hypothetical protein
MALGSLMKGGDNMIEFIASLPPIMSAITVSGNGDGARVKLDIPQSEMAAIVQLQLMQGRALKVTVEDLEGEDRQ